MNGDRYDVAVVGGSLAGCAAAILLARLGLSVALVERRADPAAYKVACTHFIQASATPTIRRLGVDTAIEAAGGVRNNVEVWTRWGWIRPSAHPQGPGEPHGYSIRRQTLDPLLRRMAIETAGVEPLLGYKLADLTVDVGGARLGLASSAGTRRVLSARLLVGADGRGSTVAALARIPARELPNRRFAYWGYYRDVALPLRTSGRMWHLDPDAAYALPNDGDLTLLVVMPAVERLAAFKADRLGAFEALLAQLPDGPPLESAQRVTPLLGRMPSGNVSRPPTRHRLALIGDAALACDPLPGVGCGWALQSAAWLADAVDAALGRGEDPNAALPAYALRHRSETGDHFRLIAALSLARPPGLPLRLLLEGATVDERLAARVIALTQRRIHVRDCFGVVPVARIAAAVATKRVRAARTRIPTSRRPDHGSRPSSANI